MAVNESERGVASGVRVLIPVSWAGLPMRVRTETPLSDDALFELCRVNRDLRIERTPQGEVLIMAPTGGEAGKRNLKVLTRLGVWAERDGTGVAFDSSTGFLLPNGAERSPDGAWVRGDRWNALSREEQRKLVPLCPDFVIAIRSPTDTLTELQAKMREYRDCGASLGWLLDLDARRAYVYRPGAEPVALEEAAEIAGDPELPSFVLDLKAID